MLVIKGFSWHDAIMRDRLQFLHCATVIHRLIVNILLLVINIINGY